MNNNEERRNNGQGIFYAVIGVATLVVTIIGATFAFFSASAGSNENAISTGAAIVSLKLDEDRTGIKNNLIPMDETNSKFASVVGAGAKNCQDDNGNNICSVYQFTLTNPATNTAAQTVYPTITAQTNEFTNLHYIIFKGPVTKISTTANFASGTASPVSSAPLSPIGTVVDDGTIVVANEVAPATGVSHIATGTANATNVLKLQNMIQTLPVGGSITYTVVMWIHETGGNQTDVDSVISGRARIFEAGITFTTAGGSGGVTGKLSTT